MSSPLLVTGFRDKIFAIDRATGEVRWRVQLTNSGYTGCVELAIDDTLIVACTPVDLAFIDYTTGTIRNQVSRLDKTRGDRAIMVLDGGNVFIGSRGAVACYSGDGELLWEQGFKGEGYGDVALGFPHNVRQADKSGSHT